MLDSTAVKLDNVEQLITQIESAKLNVQIFESLKQGWLIGSRFGGNASFSHERIQEMLL